MIQNTPATVYRQTLNKTFITAFSGIKYFFKTERNGKIQAGVSLITIISGLYLNLNAYEWIVIVLCIGSVLALEMINTALEHLCNMVHKDYHPSIKIIKDVAAGAVLIFSIISVVAGLIIFLPKLFLLL
jgi:diacylglycerol kinase